MNPQKLREVTPLEIAPEEIWMYIFDLLEANDLVDVSLTCRSFSNFLRRKKVTFLFGNVLPIIATSMDLDALLACRGVSKQWRVETDMFLESRGVTQMCHVDNETGRKKYVASFLCPTLTFDMERMAEFQQSMKDHPTNPFVGRTVELDLEEDDFGPVVRDTVLLFIENFGQHIWHFQYDDKGEPENNENIMTLDGAYERFKNIAEGMPNLRSICFSIDNLKNSEPAQEDEIHDGHQLIDLMAASPPPKLPFLKMLDLDFGDSLFQQERGLSLHCPIQCQKIYHNILWAYGPQLERLEIKWYYWNPFFPMVNLTELRLNSFETNNSLEWINSCIISSRPCSSTQLSLPSLLSLEFEFSYCDVDIDCFMIFLQNTWEICGSFQILRLKVCIVSDDDNDEDDDDDDDDDEDDDDDDDDDGTFLSADIVLAQKSDDYDSELEWLRFMVTEFVNECMSF